MIIIIIMTLFIVIIFIITFFYVKYANYIKNILTLNAIYIELNKNKVNTLEDKLLNNLSLI